MKDATRYNIEPFFWSSSLSWIPSRFQEEIQPGIGDRKLIFFYNLHVFEANFHVSFRHYYQSHFLAVHDEP